MGAIGANGAFDIGRESQNDPLPPVTPAETEAEIETLAEALMRAHLSTPGCTITDREKALAYHRSEAMRRLDLIRQRAAENLAQRSREEAQAAANCARADREREGTP
jgi:hypothetical protein